MILAPLLARLIYLAVSRKREYLADACGALYTRYPEGLARALEKLGGSPVKLRRTSAALAPMYIVNLGSTHPPISERVTILRSMGTRAGVKSYDDAFRRVTGRPVGLLPFAALRAAPEVSVQAPPPAVAAPFTHVERVRETTDLLWAMNDYIFINCPCETKLKVPPAFRGKKIECPLNVLWGDRAAMGRQYDVLGIWQAEGTRVEGKAMPGGHSFQVDSPVETAAELRRFFASV